MGRVLLTSGPQKTGGSVKGEPPGPASEKANVGTVPTQALVSPFLRHGLAHVNALNCAWGLFQGGPYGV